MSKAKEPDPTESVAGKRAFLEEHVLYERGMLAYAFARLHDAPPGLAWNMAYECFGIHARNLYQFLRNAEDKKTNLRACDYTPNAPKPGAFRDFNSDINAFLFHVSVGRVKRDKLELRVLQELGAWLDRHWRIWVVALPEGYAGVLDPAPVCQPRQLQMGVSPHTACTAVTASSFTSVPVASGGPSFTATSGPSRGA